MPSLYSDLVDNDDHWVQPVLDHAAALAVVGNAAASDVAASCLALTNLSTRTPTILAFTRCRTRLHLLWMQPHHVPCRALKCHTF